MLPADGSTVSNPALREALGWTNEADTDRYYAARDGLEDAGLIVRGRGRGGTVRLTRSDVELGADAVPADAGEELKEIEAVVSGEVALYEPMRSVIAGDWARLQRLSPLAVEITAQQGRRDTGGIWSRPDIASVEVRTFSYVPGKYIELITFEVKPSNGITVQAVYEALAHRRASTRSYVLLHVPDEKKDELEPVVADVAEVARTHAIGLIVAGDPGDHSTWEEREAAQRVEPDPERLDRFVATQLSEAAQHSITLALR